jgi:hypothetical protein
MASVSRCRLEKTLRLYERSKMYRQQEVSRVLARSNARLVNEDEYEQVAGGVHTAVCTIINCNPDGDCPPIGCPPA